MQPLKLTIYPKDVNALEYMLHMVSGNIDAASDFDQDYTRARKLLPELLFRVREYRKATKLPLTPQWERLATTRDKRKADQLVSQYRKKGYKVMTGHNAGNVEIEIYILKKGDKQP